MLLSAVSVAVTVGSSRTTSSVRAGPARMVGSFDPASPVLTADDLRDGLSRALDGGLQRKHVALLGSTGSIGTQSLDIAREYPDYFEVVSLAAGSNVDLLAQQARPALLSSHPHPLLRTREAAARPMSRPHAHRSPSSVPRSSVSRTPPRSRPAKRPATRHHRRSHRRSHRRTAAAAAAAPPPAPWLAPGRPLSRDLCATLLSRPRPAAQELRDRIRALGAAVPEIVAGPEGQTAVATAPGADTVVTGVVGCAGLLPTVEAIKLGRTIALANKAPPRHFLDTS